jgi:hypothetical protein
MAPVSSPSANSRSQKEKISWTWSATVLEEKKAAQMIGPDRFFFEEGLNSDRKLKLTRGQKRGFGC